MHQSKFMKFAAVGIAALMLTACVPVTREGAAGHAAAAEPGAAHADAAAHAAPHWGYTGEEGPDNWGNLSPEYAACNTGKTQSPIDIKDVNKVDLANIAFHYQPAPMTIVNNGHTIEVVYPASSYIELDGERYNLQQFHFHSPSEHEIGGKQAALELHLVHKNKDGKIAVVGILFQEGAESTALAPIWAHIPAKPGPEEEVAGVTIDASTLLPSDQTTFRYQGSLTTPPCTEGVSWLVMTQESTLSAEQLKAFQAVYDGNNRPVQALDGRQIQEDVSK